MTLDDELLDDVRELIRLNDGLESGNVTCACRRIYRIVLSAELRAVMKRLKTRLGYSAVGENRDPALVEVFLRRD